MRGFRRISLKTWMQSQSENSYQYITLPKRATASSAGYDFCTPVDITIKAHQEVIVATGIKSYMETDEVLLIIIRSSLGFKYNIRLKNQVGVIDSDYYDNPSNEGHIMIALKNEGETDVTIKAQERIAQGIFTKYLLSDDDDVAASRIGGIGSTSEQK